jgi:hypothetical protein
MRRAQVAFFVATLAVAGTAGAVEPPSGLVFTTGVAGGAELGLKDQQAGIAEAEFALGWEHEGTGVRPEVALGLGLTPEAHFALRPGLRWVAPGQPVQIRVALDWSNAREEKHWRWLLVGGAFEFRWTSAFSLYAGLDFGFPLGAQAGLPLLIRGGAAFRL